MTTNEVIQILEEISTDCHERNECFGCPFDLPEQCALRYIPEQWELRKLISLMERNDKE